MHLIKYIQEQEFYEVLLLVGALTVTNGTVWITQNVVNPISYFIKKSLLYLHTTCKFAESGLWLDYQPHWSLSKHITVECSHYVSTSKYITVAEFELFACCVLPQKVFVFPYIMTDGQLVKCSRPVSQNTQHTQANIRKKLQTLFWENL
jgi:hypothetical protein